MPEYSYEQKEELRNYLSHFMYILKLMQRKKKE